MKIGLRWTILVVSAPAAWMAGMFGVVGTVESLSSTSGSGLIFASSFVAATIGWFWFLVETVRGK